MMRLLAFVIAVWPQGALALSCMSWGVQNAYLEAEASADGYVPVLGTLHFDKSRLPIVDLSRQEQVPASTSIPASFQGLVIGRRGDQPWSTNLTLDVACYGPWCSQPKPGPVLALLRKNGGQYRLETNPCGGFLFVSPTEAQVRALRDCLAGRTCRQRALR